MIFSLIYGQFFDNNEWTFTSTNFEEANKCLLQYAFNNEPIHIPVIVMQRGGPSDDDNRLFLQQITEKIGMGLSPTYFVFDFMKKVEIGSGLDASTVADSDSVDPEGFKIRDQLMNDKTVLNVLQSEKTTTSGYYAYDNVPYDKDIIQLQQDDISANAFIHEVGKWLGLKITANYVCSSDLVDDTLPDNCDTDNFMQFPGSTRSRFTQGQIFRMLNTFYWRKNGMMYEYSQSAEFMACSTKTQLFVPQGSSEGFLRKLSGATEAPALLETIDLDFNYSHYDYLEGIDSLINSIRSRSGLYDIVFNVHWFHNGDIIPGILDLIIANFNEGHRRSGSPIRFNLASFQQIEESEFSGQTAGFLQDKYGVFETTTVNVFSGVGNGGGFAGMIDGDDEEHKGSIYIHVGDNAEVAEEVLHHEAGHWLALGHTFDGGCEPGDYVSDTKPIKYEEDGTIAFDSCGYTGDFRNNYMDYGQTVDNPIYTPGQVYRMMIVTYFRFFKEMPEYRDGLVQ